MGSVAIGQHVLVLHVYVEVGARAVPDFSQAEYISEASSSIKIDTSHSVSQKCI